MPQVTVELTEAEDALVERLVRSGRYESRSAVLIEALHLLEEDETPAEPDFDDEASRSALLAAIRVGLDDLEAGRYVELRSSAEIDAFVQRVTERAIKQTERRAAE